MILTLLVSVALAATIEVTPVDDIVSVTSSLSPGTEIVFTDGTYTLPSSLTWTALGTADAPVVLRAKDGAHPVLELATGYLIAYIDSSSYLTIKGLTFRGGDPWEDNGLTGVEIINSSNVTFEGNEISQTEGSLLYLAGNNTNLTVQNNHLHDSSNGYGLYIGCSDASCWTQDSTFRGNWIHDVTGSYSFGIWLGPGGQANTLQDNVIYNTGYRGMRVDSTEYGEPNVVQGNVIWNANEVGLDVRGASRVRNNLVFNITGIGIKSAGNDRNTYEDAVISHNTVVNTKAYAGSFEDQAANTNVIANNVFCNPTGYGMYVEDVSDTAVTDYGYISHNVVCGLVDVPDAILDTILPGGGYTDYLDQEGWNFYPAIGATLIDAGDPAGDAWVPDTDFNDAPREGDAPDIGAYEWSGESNPGWAIQEDFKETGYSANPGEEVGGGCCGDDGEKSTALLLLPLLGLGTLRRRVSREARR